MFCTRCGSENAASSAYCIQCGHKLNVQPPMGENSSASTWPIKGRILAFDEAESRGIISGNDGKRYRFRDEEWGSEQFPRPGMYVEFLPEESEATEIYSLPEDPTSNAAANKNQVTGTNHKVAAGILAILLGWLGIHKFYLGYTGPGVILLLAGTLGWILVVPPLIAAIVGLIEGIIYLTKSDEEFVRIYVVGRQEWF